MASSRMRRIEVAAIVVGSIAAVAGVYWGITRDRETEASAPRTRLVRVELQGVPRIVSNWVLPSDYYDIYFSLTPEVDGRRLEQQANFAIRVSKSGEVSVAGIAEFNFPALSTSRSIQFFLDGPLESFIGKSPDCAKGFAFEYRRLIPAEVIRLELSEPLPFNFKISAAGISGVGPDTRFPQLDVWCLISEDRSK